MVICPRSPNFETDVKDMQETQKPMATPLWIEQCCHKNQRLDWRPFSVSPFIRKNQVKMEDIPINLSGLPSTLSSSALPSTSALPSSSLQARTSKSSHKLPAEPKPPRPHQTMHSSGGTIFTTSDVDYLRKFLIWKLYHDEHAKVTEISREIAKRVGVLRKHIPICLLTMFSDSSSFRLILGKVHWASWAGTI